MGRLTTWVAAGMAALATMLFVTAVSASAAPVNATVHDDGTAYVYDGFGVDQVLIGTNGTKGVTFNSSIFGGSPIDAVAPCASATFGAECPGIKPVLANLGDMDDFAELGSAAPPTTVHAGLGNDVLRGGTDGADDLHGGPGVDTFDHPGATPTKVSLDDVANDGPTGIANVHSDVELVSTGAGDDQLVGDDGPNGLAAGGGNDTIDGRGGRDDLRGGPGDDTIQAHDGFRDTIDCGVGNDVATIDPADIAVNCETLVYADDDHDTFTADRDCDDHDPSSFPGAPEVPGDGIDQDCDGLDAPAILEFVTVDGGAAAPDRVRSGLDGSWLVRARYTKVTRMVVADVPSGGVVQVRCKGCGLNHKRVAPQRGRAALTKLFKGRKLKPGTVIDVRVSAPGLIGRVVQFTVRAKRLPAKTTLCLEPGGSTPLRCA